MKKILFVLISIFILTGCEATYTINIDDNYNEVINVTSSNPQQLSNITNYKFYNPAFYDETNISDEGEKLSGVEYYKYDYDANGITASYKFGKNYSRSAAVKYCMPSLTITDDEIVTVRSTVDFNCFKYEPELDKVTVNIITKNEVVSTNADSSNGNTYTWVFEKEGSYKSINLQYKNPNYKKPSNKKDDKQKNENDNKQNNKKQSTGVPWYLYALLSLFFVIFFGIIIIRNKKK